MSLELTNPFATASPAACQAKVYAAAAKVVEQCVIAAFDKVKDPLK